MKHTDNRFAELDAFRGIAAMCVVIFHFTSVFRKDYGYHFPQKYDFDLGHYGVELFFVISGFVIFMTLQKIRSVGDFAFRRFSRLYPSYWICIIITITAITLFGLPGKEITLKQGLINLTMVQGLFKVIDVDGSYWSLLPELLFYFMMGFLFQFKLLKKIQLIGFVWLLAIIANRFHHLPFFSTFLNLRYGMFFFAGILFYKLKFTNDSSKLDHLLILLCGVTAVIIEGTVTYAIVVGLILGLFYLFVYQKLAFISIRPFLFLGYISYPLYLIHQYVGFTVLLKLRSLQVNEVLSMAITTAFVIFLAWLITAHLEKPILEYLRKISNSKRHIVVTTNNE